MAAQITKSKLAVSRKIPSGKGNDETKKPKELGNKDGTSAANNEEKNYFPRRDTSDSKSLQTESDAVEFSRRKKVMKKTKSKVYLYADDSKSDNKVKKTEARKKIIKDIESDTSEKQSVYKKYVPGHKTRKRHVKSEEICDT